MAVGAAIVVFACWVHSWDVSCAKSPEQIYVCPPRDVVVGFATALARSRMDHQSNAHDMDAGQDPAGVIRDFFSAEEEAIAALASELSESDREWLRAIPQAEIGRCVCPSLGPLVEQIRSSWESDPRRVPERVRGRPDEHACKFVREVHGELTGGVRLGLELQMMLLPKDDGDHVARRDR